MGLVVLAAAIVPGALKAQTASSDESVVMGYNPFPPYSFTNENGQADGFSIDIARELARELGITITFREYANPGAVLEALRAEEVELTTIYALTEARRDAGLFTKPIGAFTTSAFVLKGGPVLEAKDLASRRIAATRGSYGLTVAGQTPFAEIVLQDSLTASLLPLLSGQVDAVVAPTNGFLRILRNHGLDTLVMPLEPSLAAQARGFIVSPARPALLSALDGAIADRLTDRQVAALQARWFGEPSSLLGDTRVLGMLAIAVVSLVLVIGALLSLVRVRGSARRAFASHERNRLLVDALDGIDMSIVIFDTALRPVYWNDGTIRSCPDLVKALKAGQTMTETIATTLIGSEPSEAGATRNVRARAEAMVRDALSGTETTRHLKLADGRVFELSEFPIGGDYVAAVRKDITRVETQAQKIREQSEALEQVNDRLRSFSIVAAHDLKSPLLQQDLLLQMAQEDMSAGKHTDALANMALVQRSNAALKRLMNDLISYSLEKDDADRPVRFDPLPRIQGVLDQISPPKGFEIALPKTMPQVTAAPEAFDIVMRNLLSNCIKHHDKPHGRIELHAKQDGTMVQIEIVDDGPGIPDGFERRIFSAFERLGPKSEESGTGLGLALVNKLVERWGGTVSASSPGPRGTVFHVAVPVADQGFRRRADGDIVPLNHSRSA
ncbi:transporter substrate-binding domain-containing protein [Cognatishimia sp. F0-27]|uniref:ATP-binding protein n=1 Tax=Cognatishimia sp. F0-27 TaxID=2816855 RepID=UPI001D0CC4A2|nr:transporter substrate-binding domain-containing protein [Cognatishimia sp. F0-27]